MLSNFSPGIELNNPEGRKQLQISELVKHTGEILQIIRTVLYNSFTYFF